MLRFSSVARTACAVLCFCLALVPAARAEEGRADPDETWMPPDLNWNQARELVVELQDNLFEPPALNFERGVPYRLVLRNVGHRPHDLVDPDFFHAIVVRRITNEAGSVITPHIHSLYVQPGKETVIYFVAVKEGVSAFFCSIPGHREDGMEGEVHVH